MSDGPLIVTLVIGGLCWWLALRCAYELGRAIERTNHLEMRLRDDR